MSVSKIWNTLFLEARPSIGLSFFRIFVALTTGLHVIPSFFHLDDNYFSTAFKLVNENFFTPEILALVGQSSDALVVFLVGIFVISWFSFLIGLYSQISCIVMTACCYYFYALNDFHIGTLSWDILLVTLFLMCVTPYHGDYFSVDALRKKNVLAFKQTRPFFLQRLLQLQIASTYFFTALCKISSYGNWLTGNPIYYLMNYPPQGVTKNFLIKEWMATQPTFCYWMGIFILSMELMLPFLLFNPKTRRSAIVMGFVFHIVLILTLDVPAIFLFLFPAQMLLFIHPQKIMDWINRQRALNALSPRYKIVYDGQCPFCLRSIEQLKVMDLFDRCEYVDYHSVANLQLLHPALNPQAAAAQMHLLTPNGKIYGGFFAFRQLGWIMPMLSPMLLVMYLPLMDWIGSIKYRFIAQNRYRLNFNNKCEDNRCHKP